MTTPVSIDVNELVDGQRIGRRMSVLLIIALLAMMSDGFDLAAIGYVGPELTKAWQISPAQLVPVFTSGIVGLLIGAPLFGFLGDRFGRRKAIIAGLCFFGVISLLTAFASTLPHLVVMRFLTGVGLGGVIPNVNSLVAEMSPRRFRGGFLVIVNFGVAVGIAITGLVAASLVPVFGWHSLVIVGGLLPLAVAIIAFFLLPESIKFTAERGNIGKRAVLAARALRPDLDLAEGTIFVTAGQRRTKVSLSPKSLFQGQLAIVTPMIWLALAANQMANFFALTWLPTLLQSLGSSTAQAGTSGSLFAAGGLIGGLLLVFVIDRLGVIPLVAFFFIGAPLIAAIGLVENAHMTQWLIIAAAGLCVNGINFGINAALAIIYPTSVRSLGSGWAQAAGRVGAIAAPIVGGAMLGLQYKMQDVLVAPAILMLAGGIASVVLCILCIRRFGSVRLNEFTVVASSRSSFGSPDVDMAVAKQNA